MALALAGPAVGGFYRDLHPAAHYWPLQLVAASGALLPAAVLVTLAAFRLLRRRAGKAVG